MTGGLWRCRGSHVGRDLGSALQGDREQPCRSRILWGSVVFASADSALETARDSHHSGVGVGASWPKGKGLGIEQSSCRPSTGLPEASAQLQGRVPGTWREINHQPKASHLEGTLNKRGRRPESTTKDLPGRRSEARSEMPFSPRKQAGTTRFHKCWPSEGQRALSGTADSIHTGLVHPWLKSLPLMYLYRNVCLRRVFTAFSRRDKAKLRSWVWRAGCQILELMRQSSAQRSLPQEVKRKLCLSQLPRACQYLQLQMARTCLLHRGPWGAAGQGRAAAIKHSSSGGFQSHWGAPEWQRGACSFCDLGWWSLHSCCYTPPGLLSAFPSHMPQCKKEVTHHPGKWTKWTGAEA